MTAFKVLRSDLTSLGLRAAKHSRIKYAHGKWMKPKEPLQKEGDKGGLHVAPTIAAAKDMKRYVAKNHGLRTRVFLCEIGEIFWQTSCRIKTDKVKLIAEIKI